MREFLRIPHSLPLRTAMATVLALPPTACYSGRHNFEAFQGINGSWDESGSDTTNGEEDGETTGVMSGDGDEGGENNKWDVLRPDSDAGCQIAYYEAIVIEDTCASSVPGDLSQEANPICHISNLSQQSIWTVPPENDLYPRRYVARPDLSELPLGSEAEIYVCELDLYGPAGTQSLNTIGNQQIDFYALANPSDVDFKSANMSHFLLGNEPIGSIPEVTFPIEDFTIELDMEFCESILRGEGGVVGGFVAKQRDETPPDIAAMPFDPGEKRRLLASTADGTSPAVITIGICDPEAAAG